MRTLWRVESLTLFCTKVNCEMAESAAATAAATVVAACKTDVPLNVESSEFDLNTRRI